MRRFLCTAALVVVLVLALPFIAIWALVDDQDEDESSCYHWF